VKRIVDRTKKSNIKCEHCEHFKNGAVCKLTLCPEKYWNKCNKFEWRKLPSEK
jgi:hypothetical protein